MRIALALAVFALGWIITPAWAAEPAPCPIPEELVTPDEPLTAVRAAIKSHLPIHILAIGSASTNAAPGGPHSSFPYEAVQGLRAALPGTEITLSVKGRRGLTAAEMAPLIEQGLKEDHISLVLWQTGTVEAVRGLSPSDLEDALSEGARAILDAGADGILIDPQYSHFLHANVDLEPYEQALEHVASLFPHLTLFRRFELMHSWADDGVLDLERMEPDERHAAIARLHQCLGAALTRFIMHGVEQSAEQ